MLEDRTNVCMKEERLGLVGHDRTSPRQRQFDLRTNDHQTVRSGDQSSQAKRTVHVISEMMEGVKCQIDKVMFKTGELKELMDSKNSDDDVTYWKCRCEETERELNELKSKHQLLPNEQSDRSEASLWRQRAEELEREVEGLRATIRHLESEYNEVRGRQKLNDGDHEYIIQVYQQKAEEAQEMCARACRENTDLKEHVSVLQAQLLIYKDDFENERRDREMTQGKTVDLEKQVKHLEGLLRQQQSLHRYPVSLVAGRDVTDMHSNQTSPPIPLLISRGPSDVTRGPTDFTRGATDVTDCATTHPAVVTTIVDHVTGSCSSRRSPVVQETPFQTDSALLEVDDFDEYLSELATNFLPMPGARNETLITNSPPSFCRTSAPSTAPKAQMISLMEDVYPALIPRTGNPSSSTRLVPLSASTSPHHRVGNNPTNGNTNAKVRRNNADELLHCTKCYKEFTLDEHFELMEHMDECDN